MTLKQMISDVRARVRELAPKELTDDLIRHWLNEGQKDFARRTLCLASKAETVAAKGVAVYALPDDAVRVQSVKFDGAVMGEIPLVECEDTEGAPVNYAMLGSRSIQLSPAPDEDNELNLEITYFQTPAPMVNPTDESGLPVWMHAAVVLYAVVLAYRSSPNVTEAQMAVADRVQNEYMAMLNEQYVRLRRNKRTQWGWERAARR